MLTARSSLSNALREFARARAGNVAVIFAIAVIPIIGMVGAAVDYSHANSVKVAMQAALDSAALMLSKDAAKLSDDVLDAKALEYFRAVFTRPEAKNIKIDATYTSKGGSKVVVDGKADMSTSFMQALGIDKIPVGGSSTTRWGSARLRVALALDNTGSMASAGKMIALKVATTALLAQLKSAATTNGDVYVSIIPFSKDVNVGRHNFNANWIDWSDWDSKNQTCSGNGGGNGRGNGRGSGRGGNQTCTPKNHNTWNGCVMDRGSPSPPGSAPGYDQKVDAPNPTVAASLFPAEQYSDCPVEMMGLNYDWMAMNSLVASMRPDGNTNQPIGLVWAWQSLVGGGPLTVPPTNSNYHYEDIIILMSDGLNTENRWYSDRASVDARMYHPGNGSGTCANIKAAGITIYTIHVNTHGDPLSALLQQCASGPDKFWMITSANALVEVFDAIATDITKLRVAE